MEKFSIIGGDIHCLVQIHNKKQKEVYPWLIHEEENWYWIPVQDHKKTICGIWVYQDHRDKIQKVTRM